VLKNATAIDLTVAQFAARYGQKPATITALQSYLNKYGIATSVYPDGLDVTASGTAAEFDRALSVQQQYKVPAMPAQWPDHHRGPAGARHHAERGWGGTSFGALQLNGAAALIDQAVGHRTGLWNPAIYGFALSASSPFTPLSAQGTTNDNLYYTGTPGQVFNPGSGLGYADLAKLAGDFGLPGVQD